jgi:hypothetical protein
LENFQYFAAKLQELLVRLWFQVGLAASAIFRSWAEHFFRSNGRAKASLKRLRGRHPLRVLSALGMDWFLARLWRKMVFGRAG